MAEAVKKFEAALQDYKDFL